MPDVDVVGVLIFFFPFFLGRTAADLLLFSLSHAFNFSRSSLDVIDFFHPICVATVGRDGMGIRAESPMSAMSFVLIWK